MNFGNIFSLAAIGAVIAGGIALYSNRDKIGGAFSRGIETNLTNPLGNYFDNLWTGAPGNAAPPGAPAPNGNAPAVNPVTVLDPLPVATAQTATGDAGISPSNAQKLTDKYLPGATQSAKTALDYVQNPRGGTFTNTNAIEDFIKRVQTIGKATATPELSTNFAIVDEIRKSINNPGQDSSRNKFYNLFTLNNQPYAQGRIGTVPLSQSAVLNYAKRGIIAREAYL